jgi:hypothetical protein
MSYWSLCVSTRKVQFCFCKMVMDGGCKTAIVKNCSFAFAFATWLGTALPHNYAVVVIYTVFVYICIYIYI